MQCRLRHCECVFVVQYEMKRHMCDKEMFVQNHYGSLTVACAKVRTRHSQGHDGTDEGDEGHDEGLNEDDEGPEINEDD